MISLILRGHLWGAGFQVLGTEECQNTGGNGRNPLGQEGWICSGNRPYNIKGRSHDRPFKKYHQMICRLLDIK